MKQGSSDVFQSVSAHNINWPWVRYWNFSIYFLQILHYTPWRKNTHTILIVKCVNLELKKIYIYLVLICKLKLKFTLKWNSSYCKACSFQSESRNLIYEWNNWWNPQKTWNPAHFLQLTYIQICLCPINPTHPPRWENIYCLYH